MSARAHSAMPTERLFTQCSCGRTSACEHVRLLINVPQAYVSKPHSI
jgi:hypothetical protein